MRLPLRIRRLICRYRGHDSGRIVKYGEQTVIVGEGCRRCEVGTTFEYMRLGPVPRMVKDAGRQ